MTIAFTLKVTGIRSPLDARNKMWRESVHRKLKNSKLQTLSSVTFRHIPQWHTLATIPACKKDQNKNTNSSRAL